MRSRAYSRRGKRLESWWSRLRATREQLGVSREELARRSGVPAHTLRRWEDGTRRPRPAGLRAVLGALDCPNAEANAILSELGAQGPRTNFPADRFPHYFFTVPELQQFVEQAPWPEFVINDNIEVVAANTAAQALWQANFAHERRTRTGPQMNLLSVANDYRFTERVLNWEECVAIIAGVLKGRPNDAHTLEEPDPYFSIVLEEFAKGDPTFLAQMIEILAKTPARDPKVRWSYRVAWRDDDFGDMRFQAIVSTASEPDGLSFNDWHPLDAESWSVLDRVKARGIPPAPKT